MSAFIGNLGGVSISPETTWGTPVAPATSLWALGCTLKPEKTLIETEHLSMVPQNHSTYTPSFATGEITTHFSFVESIFGDILGNLATPSGVGPYTYDLGADLSPENPGLTVDVNHGGSNGVVYRYSGMKVNKLTIEFEPQKYAKSTIGLIGKQPSKQTGATFTAPAVSNIASHSDFYTLTIGGTQLNVKSGTITVERPLTGGDRSYVGATALMEPEQTGPMMVTGSLVVELSDTASFDSEAIIDAFLAETALGTILLGSEITMSNCRMLGDHPALGAGIQEFPINFVSTQCDVDLT